MNIEFLKFKKSFSKKDFQIDLTVYWKTILCFMFLMLIVSSIFGFNLFIKTNKDSTFTNVNTRNQVENERKTRIENVVKYFSEREKISNDISSYPSLFVDPSL